MIAVTTHGRFHSFDLARQLLKRDLLAGIYTAFPRFAVSREGIPNELLHCFPYFQGPGMALRRYLKSNSIVFRATNPYAGVALDWYVARHLPPVDVLVALSGSGLKSGQLVQDRGGVYVCDRGSSHKRYQERIVEEEFLRLGLQPPPRQPKELRREEAEYAVADIITVPSSFALKSFVDEGIPESKMRVVPYGVSLSLFGPTNARDESRFDVIFVGAVGVRKGIHYLLDAFQRVTHPRKSLKIVGGVLEEAKPILEAARVNGVEFSLAGRLPRKDLALVFGGASVLVLPSIEEGLALVMAEAMACGCPVVASENTGASNLFSDGVEGFIVPPRSVEALTGRLQFLADNPSEITRMSHGALSRVQSIGGWDQYGASFLTAIS